jgi:hypothetical protein
MKIWQIARRLFYQNRWIYLLLFLFPIGMALLLMVAGEPPAPEDVVSILHQECLYGLGLVAFTGGALLGNEQRSRRIITVLSRAVGRRAYFAALLTTAWLPLFAYTTSFIISGRILAQAMPKMLALGAMELMVGLWTAVAALFFSTWLPMMLASTAALGSLALLGGLGYQFPWFAPGRILFMLTQGDLRTAAELIHQPAGFLLLLVGAALLFAGGLAIFEHRDLALKND